MMQLKQNSKKHSIDKLEQKLMLKKLTIKIIIESSISLKINVIINAFLLLHGNIKLEIMQLQICKNNKRERHSVGNCHNPDIYLKKVIALATFKK